MDKKLQGHVIWHQSVFSELQCEDLCIRVPDCLAYNHHYSAEMAEKACELMNEVRAVNNTPGYSFRLFERERVLKVSNRLLYYYACKDATILDSILLDVTCCVRLNALLHVVACHGR